MKPLFPDNPTQPPSLSSRDVLQEAAQWYATLRADEVTDDERMQWKAWLANDPSHARAWQRVESISQQFASLHAAGDGPALLAGAQAARRSLQRRRTLLRCMAGLGGGAMLGWWTWNASPLAAHMAALRADHHTDTGEQRELVLADGTHLWLNTASAVDVILNAQVRLIQLVAGEILVETARDPSNRPFHVQTPHGRMQALGTRFAVHNTMQATQLHVYEGAVQVVNASRLERLVSAGSSVQFDGTHIENTLSADPAREAWQRGILMASNLSLEAFAQELSRYGNAHIHVDSAIAGLQVVGVFPALDRDRALAMLQAELPVRARQLLPWWISLIPA